MESIFHHFTNAELQMHHRQLVENQHHFRTWWPVRDTPKGGAADQQNLRIYDKSEEELRLVSHHLASRGVVPLAPRIRIPNPQVG